MYTSTQKLNTPWVSNVLSLMKHAWMFIFPRLDQFSSFVGNKTMTASFVYRGENISRIIELIENIGLIYRCSRYFVQWQIVETMSILRARELSLPRIKLEYFFNFQVFYECRRNWTKTTFVSDDSRSIVERKDIQRKVERVEQIATDYSAISSNLIDETSV